jgi:hypothetical protein
MNRRFAIEKGRDTRLTEEPGKEEEAADEHYEPEQHIEEALTIEADKYDEYIVDEQCNIVHNSKAALRRGSIEMHSIARRYDSFETRTSGEEMPISFPGWTSLMPLTRIGIRRVAFCWRLALCSTEKAQRIKFPVRYYIRKKASMESTDMES